MFVDEITYGTFSGGVLNGHVGFTINFTGMPAVRGTDELAAVAEAIYRHRRGVTRTVFFVGSFTEENALDVLTLLRSFANAKFDVVAISDGARYFSWFTQLKYLIVDTSSDRFLGFEAGEIWYHIEEDGADDLVLPDIAVKPRMYLVAGPEVTPKGLFQFLKSSNHPWNVWLYPETPYVEIVSYQGGVE